MFLEPYESGLSHSSPLLSVNHQIQNSLARSYSFIHSPEISASFHSSATLLITSAVTPTFFFCLVLSVSSGFRRDIDGMVIHSWQWSSTRNFCVFLILSIIFSWICTLCYPTCNTRWGSRQRIQYDPIRTDRILAHIDSVFPDESLIN